MPQDIHTSGGTLECSDSPTMSRVWAFVNQGVPCCRRDCLRRVWESYRDDLQQFEDTVAACSREAKEAALLMNLREHLTWGPPRRTKGGQAAEPCGVHHCTIWSAVSASLSRTVEH